MNKDKTEFIAVFTIISPKILIIATMIFYLVKKFFRDCYFTRKIILKKFCLMCKNLCIIMLHFGFVVNQHGMTEFSKQRLLSKSCLAPPRRGAGIGTNLHRQIVGKKGAEMSDFQLRSGNPA